MIELFENTIKIAEYGHHQIEESNWLTTTARTRLVQPPGSDEAFTVGDGVEIIEPFELTFAVQAKGIARAVNAMLELRKNLEICNILRWKEVNLYRTLATESKIIYMSPLPQSDRILDFWKVTVSLAPRFARATVVPVLTLAEYLAARDRTDAFYLPPELPTDPSQLKPRNLSLTLSGGGARATWSRPLQTVIDPVFYRVHIQNLTYDSEAFVETPFGGEATSGHGFSGPPGSFYRVTATAVYPDGTESEPSNDATITIPEIQGEPWDDDSFWDDSQGWDE